MCFSAGASFVASGVLGAAGGATLAQTREKKTVPLASIPLFFAIQQFLEGLVWLSLSAGTLNSAAAYAYSFFAFVFWPIWIPVSTWLLEENPFRKKIIAVLGCIGIGTGLYLFSFLLAGELVVIEVGNSIRYSLPVEHWWVVTFLYVLATCASAVASSHRMVRVLGVAVFASLLIAGAFFLYAAASVWCFFSALLSVIVLFHVRANRHVG